MYALIRIGLEAGISRIPYTISRNSLYNSGHVSLLTDYLEGKNTKWVFAFF